jgi:hypothetical protein
MFRRMKHGHSSARVQCDCDPFCNYLVSGNQAESYGRFLAAR